MTPAAAALRVLVVDDEPLARQRLEDLLVREEGVELAGSVGEGRAAVEAILDLRPDLVFLDVQMPGLTGLDVVREVGPERMPPTVFVTAYDRYALRAFELAALDYLLKPFDDERFAQVFRRAREAVRMMNEVALATEELFRDNLPQPPGSFQTEGLHPITAAVVYGAGHMAIELDAKLVVVASHSGATALALSSQRTYVPTVGISDSAKALRQMCLYWGVIPLEKVTTESTDATLAAISKWGVDAGVLHTGDYMIVIAGLGLHVGSHNQVMVHRV